MAELSHDEITADEKLAEDGATATEETAANDEALDADDAAKADAGENAPAGKQKPTKFYVDFENVHGPGLKGVDELDERDEVLIFYSQAAETFHIEHVIDILKSKARIQFVEVDGGTRNAADFQLIVALVGAMDPAYDYAIVTGDGGFDAAIKMT